MAHNAAGKYIGLGLGDSDDPSLPRNSPNWEAVTLINHKLQKYQWAKDLGVTDPNPNFDAHTEAAIAQLYPRVNMTPVLDANGDAVASLALRTRLGSYPPPAPPRHAMLTVRGTGGIIGQDYTSQIAQALPGQYEEVPIDYPATMGGIPVGVAGGGPSGDDAADIAEQMLIAWVLANPTRTFAIAGYSLGTRGVIQFLNKLADPSSEIYQYRSNLVCVVLVADPWRPFGKSFYLGPVCGGQGIGAPYFTMSAAAQALLGWRCCWLAQESDMYTNAALGAVGQILADVEQIILSTSLSDPLGTMKSIVTYLWKIVSKDGGLQTVLGLPGGKTTNEPAGQSTVDPLGGLLGGIINGNTILTIPIAGLVIALIEGLIGGIQGWGDNLEPGVEADTEAAIEALKFFGGGIQGHLTYHVNTWGPGPQTYLQLGIQHAADYGSRVPVLL